MMDGRGALIVAQQNNQCSYFVRSAGFTCYIQATGRHQCARHCSLFLCKCQLQPPRQAGHV